MQPVEILVVDDFELYRRFVCSTLQQQKEFHISEASDGLEAVQKAQELRPDLILLDIGLPNLSGIEAARRIAEVSPQSRIVYISQESSPEIVQEALRIAGPSSGYVLKSDAASELLIAVDAVLKGKSFLSRRLAFLRHAGIVSTTDDSPVRRTNHEYGRVHEVASYREDASFVDDFTRFIEAAFQAGNPVIVVATQSHRMSLGQKLHARGWDITGAIREGTYTPLDDAETLSTFMVDGWPDSVRFANIVGSIVGDAMKVAKANRSRVAVCGECAPTLLAQGRSQAAIQVEHLWDALARDHGILTLCGYVLNGSPVDENSHIFQRICAEHSAAHSR